MKQTNISILRLLFTSILLVNLLEGLSANGVQGGAKCSTEKLKAVSMLFRHGDRSPTTSYPLDPYKDYSWPGGPGALSPRGANQLYQSGLVKSTRYSSLLSLECPQNDVCSFDVDRIFVASSAIQRCVDSVNNFLNGFLRVDWPSNLVGVIPQIEDEMFAVPGKSCPKFEMTAGDPITNPIFSSVIDFQSQAGLDLLEYLRNNTGLPLVTSSELILLEDSLLIQYDHGFVLPEWSNSVWQQYLHPLTDIAFEMMGENDYMKIRSGALLKDIFDRFQSFGQETSDQNILLYSAHDATVAGLLSALGIVNQAASRPSYASSLNFELYENNQVQNDFEVKVVYFMNHAVTNPIKVNIPGCPAPCALRKFVQKFRSELTNNYDATCAI